jgi:preprotein translocase subunit SecY
MAITFNPETGFSSDSTSVIRQSIVDDWTAVFDDENATLNTSSESPAGQIIDSLAVLVTGKDSEFLNLANQFNPLQISDNLKKEGAYIPGISPGQPTADFLDAAMTRVTTGGAVFLLVLALFPMFLYNTFGIPFMVAQFFGGTSLLIMVGVVLDTMSQLESHLTMRHYDGFLKSGRLRSRSN